MLERFFALLPCFAITSSGGQFQWRELKIEWLNSIPPGSQLVGPSRWGLTSIQYKQFCFLMH